MRNFRRCGRRCAAGLPVLAAPVLAVLGIGGRADQHRPQQVTR
jgi:hypothetical protein